MLQATFVQNVDNGKNMFLLAVYQMLFFNNSLTWKLQ